MITLSPAPATAESQADRLLRLSDVVELMSLCRATVYRMVATGSFPAPVKIAGASRWRASEVARFIEALAAGSRGPRK
ncbi:MAG: AlpA family phage regulatory protein [Rhodobacteraceae bacterium]|nr:AlpA family phage regulatory protein [Paracoccaceae bacterium]MCC0066856.1 AlpA family phage regulatory protein [Rhodovulum sp.]